MAAGHHTYNYRRSDYRGRDQRQFYVYGNTVRQADPAPVRRQKARPAQPKRISRQVARNRNRAMSISPAYAVVPDNSSGMCGFDLCPVFKSAVRCG